jgi:hypothetical protein
MRCCEGHYRRGWSRSTPLPDDTSARGCNRTGDEVDEQELRRRTRGLLARGYRKIQFEELPGGEFRCEFGSLWVEPGTPSRIIARPTTPPSEGKPTSESFAFTTDAEYPAAVVDAVEHLRGPLTGGSS